MRILILLFSLFFARDLLASENVGQTSFATLHAMAPGIALNLVSGVIAQLIYPFPRHPLAALDPVHPFVATIVATLGSAMTWYNLEKSGHFRLLPMALPAFVFGVYFYCIAVDGTQYAKNKFVAWYNRHKHPNKKILKKNHDSTQE
jgi:hypothetical protein